MADMKSCGIIEPHEYHGWTEPGTGFDGKFWHACPGVKSDAEDRAETQRLLSYFDGLVSVMAAETAIRDNGSGAH